jgi:hypothetical protein
MKRNRLFILLLGIIALTSVVYLALFWLFPTSSSPGSLATEKIVLQELPPPGNLAVLNKLVAVQGRLIAIDLLPDQKTRVSLKTAVGVTIPCVVATNDLFKNFEALEFNDEVEIKGYCTGLTEDLVLSECSVSSVLNQSPL